MTSAGEHHAVTFGRLVRQKREARGWSQEALAAGVFSDSTRKGYVSLIENGKVPNITRDTVRNVARVRGIEPEDIPAELRWPEAAAVVQDTNTTVHDIKRMLEESLRRTAEAENVPIDLLRAILNEMGEAADTLDVGEIGEKLKAKAIEFKELTGRLTRLSNNDPEVSRLRRAAAEALAKGRFAQADAHLAAAEARDLESLEDLEALAQSKRLFAAETRAERAAAAKLRTSPEGYREAASHFGEAARIAQAADRKIARAYARQKGQAMIDLGAEFGLNAALIEAIEHFGAMLASADRRADPLEWAETQIYLGIALRALGERESGTARLEAAVAAYSAALEEYTRARVPLDWAMTQNNLGAALWTLGEHESGTARLEAAVAAFSAALEEWTRERVPLQWATTQNNLGNALRALGARESGTARLEAAVAAFSAALEEFTQDRAPYYWEVAQRNMRQALDLIAARRG